MSFSDSHYAYLNIYMDFIKAQTLTPSVFSLWHEFWILIFLAFWWYFYFNFKDLQVRGWKLHYKSRYQLGSGAVLNDVTIFYGGRGSMIEEKWLINSNKVVLRLGRNGSKSQENTVTTFMDGPLVFYHVFKMSWIDLLEYFYFMLVFFHEI